MQRSSAYAPRRHPFYALPLAIQAPIAVGLALLALWPVTFLFRSPLAWLFAPLMASWGFFATTPFLRMVGFYRYYSPYLCVMLPTRRRLDVHLGTSFDHLLTLRPRDRGSPARRLMLRGALDGLLAIARDIEQGTLPETVIIEGTSWFFTERTARRLGFELVAPSWFGRLIPIVISLDIMLMSSFTRGRFHLPAVGRVRRARTTGARLLAQQARIREIRDRLARSDEPAQ